MSAACGEFEAPPASTADDPTLAKELVNPLLARAVETGRELLREARGKLELDADHDFAARTAVLDELGQTHVRYNQTYRGIKVWEGEAIVHQNQRGSDVTNELKGRIHLGTRPTLRADEALAIAHRKLRPSGPYAGSPTAELVVYPQTRKQVRADAEPRGNRELNAVDMERVAMGYHLAYHVHTALENGDAETRHTDYLDQVTFSSYRQRCFPVGAYAGQTVRPHFLGTEDAAVQTSFFLDHISLL